MHILFDIGGTKMRVVGSTDLEKFDSEPTICETPQQFEEGVSMIIDAARELSGGKQIESVVGGIRGILNKERTLLTRDNVLIDWVDKPLARRLSKELSDTVHLLNDAALAGLGEARMGAGRGYRIVAYLTISTGVGGTRVVNGKLEESSTGFEPGKQTIDLDRTLDDTAQVGTLEELVSGSAVKRRLGKEPYEITQNDPMWDKLAMWLAYGLKNVVAYWSPEVIILGGAMMVGSPSIQLSAIRNHFENVLAPSFPSVPELKRAELGDFSGLYGALSYTKQQFV